MALSETALPVCLAHELARQPAEQAWLIDSLWGQAAVGILGGAPKCAKSSLGLDMALSVASATPCLGRLPVPTPGGPSLIYLAEDALPAVRARLSRRCVPIAGSRSRRFRCMSLPRRPCDWICTPTRRRCAAAAICTPLAIPMHLLTTRSAEIRRGI
jgi:hypothetical protein